MNELIKQLAAEAKIKPMGSSWASRFGAEFEEKFAELIVRECMEINKQELSFPAFERLMNKYTEHFGVE